MTLRDKKNESHEHPNLPEYIELVNKTMMVQNQMQLLISNPIFFPAIPKLQVILFAGIERMTFLLWLWRNKLSGDRPTLRCSVFTSQFASNVWFEHHDSGMADGGKTPPLKTWSLDLIISALHSFTLSSVLE